MLRETTTLGVRIAQFDRYELERDFITRRGRRAASVRVKLGLLDGELVNLAPEHDDCARGRRAHRPPGQGVWASALAAASEQGHMGTATTSDLDAADASGSRARPRHRRLLRRRRLVARRRARAARARRPRARRDRRLARARRTASSTARAPWRDADRHRARDDHDRRARPARLPRERHGPLLPLQDRALRRARGARAGARLRGACSRARTPTTSATGGPGWWPRASTASIHPLLEAGVGKAAGARARARARRAERRQGREPVPGLARALRHAGRSRDARARSTPPSRPCARSATPCCACATTASSASSSLPPTSSRARSGPTSDAAIGAAIRSAGYAHTAIDPEPFRSGNLTAAFRGRALNVIDVRGRRSA